MRQRAGSTNSCTRLTTAPDAISANRFSRAPRMPVRGGSRAWADRAALPLLVTRSAKPLFPSAISEFPEYNQYGNGELQTCNWIRLRLRPTGAPDDSAKSDESAFPPQH